jgi:KTSC domain
MIQIPLKPVQSSQIEAIGYDESSKVLAVKFINRGKTAKPPTVYHYSGIEKAFVERLNEAESKGRFIATNLIKTKAAFTKHELPTT